MFDYDVAIVGAGSGGCACAMRCADLGKKVALVECRDKGTGGTCVTRGCIPTKVLLKSAQVYQECKNARSYGVLADSVKFDMKAIHQKKNAAISTLKFGLDNMLLKPRGIARIQGRARLVGRHSLEIVGSETCNITAENIVLAMGSEPAKISAFNIDGSKIITSDEAVNIAEIPAELVIVGAGALGLEFAYLFNVFGAKVTVLEMMPHVVPAMPDEDVAAAIQACLKKSGISIKCGVEIQKISVNGDRAACQLHNGECIESDLALVAIGRSLNTTDFGLAEVGIETTARGQIATDAQMRTNIPNIYAVGDITEGPLLSHKAQKQGLVAAECIAGNNAQMNYDCIPWAIFTQPEIAGVGLTVAEAERLGIATVIGKMNFSGNEKAMSMQKTTGLIKIVAKADDRKVIGGQIFGADASILIEEIALAVKNGLTLENIADSIHAHPTLSEIVMEASKNALGMAFLK